MTTQGTPKFLIWGYGPKRQGWIASLLYELMTKQGANVTTTDVDMHDASAVREVLEKARPTHVVNCAGKTGRPNVDWCEDHRQETVRSNVIGTLVLADECDRLGLHLTVMATGCIYRSEYTPDRSTLISTPFTEDSLANFGGSFYSYTKSRVEDILRTTYPNNTLILRLRMPVSDDLHHRNFVTKIAKYDKVVNVPNSNSILHDLLPLIPLLAAHGETGVLNFTNPGAISHNEVLALYRDIVEPAKQWANFTLEEQAKVIKADRSNCELDASKLMGLVKGYQAEGAQVDVPEIHEAYRRCFERMKIGMQQQAGAEDGMF